MREKPFHMLTIFICCAKDSGIQQEPVYRVLVLYIYVASASLLIGRCAAVTVRAESLVAQQYIIVGLAQF